MRKIHGGCGSEAYSGGIYVLANVELAEIFGTGLAVIIILIGLTTGGILVDHFGLFESPKKTMNVQKIDWCLRDGVWCYFNKIIVTVK